MDCIFELSLTMDENQVEGKQKIMFSESNQFKKGQKDCKCEYCGKSFSRQQNLKTHIHTVHEGHKDHKCESCGKSFSNKGHVNHVTHHFPKQDI